jgi:Response regulator receiver domain
MRTSIRAARAVAVLLIASGAAGVASTLLPSLDERWIFVVAVAIIGAMEGFVIGFISVLVAVVAYEFMVHSSMSFTPERDLLLLGAGIASALGARAARVTAARPKIRVSQQLLLPPPTVVDEQERFMAALQIDALERKVARERARAEALEERAVELEIEHSVRLQELERERTALEHALEAARTTSESLAARVAELEETVDALEQEIETLERERGDQRRSVLLVHHDAMLRSMAKNALERNGYRVTTAGDGLEALRIAMTEKPDVILADPQMPKMDGPALAQLLKSRDETSSTKVILIGPDFLRDPSNLEEMRATIERALQRDPQSPRQ